MTTMKNGKVAGAAGVRIGTIVKRLVVAVALGGLIVALVATSRASFQEATPTETGATLPGCAAGTGAGGTPSPVSGVELADWQTITLTDARTGDQFSIGDFVGCTVYVETMATWCGECRQQLGYVAEAVKELDREKQVFISISVETEISAKDLAGYADDAGFDWIFTVGSPEMLKAIVDEFGRGAIVPPSTPHVIVRADGSFGELQTGYSKPDEIIQMMNDASGAAST